MAAKSLVVLAALLLLLVAAPTAVGQVPELPIISGVAPCSTGTNIDASAVPPFASKDQTCCYLSPATLHWLLSQGIVANLTAGVLSNQLLSSLISSLLRSNQCSVVVTTALVACNVSLAGFNGTLIAPVQGLGNGVVVTGLFSFSLA